MKKYILFIFTFCFFIMFSSSVIAEECDSTKVEKLKKQADVISAVSQFDEDGLANGIFNNNIVTVYGLPNNFYIVNKSRSVLFSDEDVVDGTVNKDVGYGDGELYVYSYDCPNQKLKTLTVELKKYNKFYASTDCDDIRDEVDVCEKFYDTDNLSYSAFKRKIKEYKKNSMQNIITKFNLIKFINDNIFITIGIGLIIFGVIIALIFKNIKNNKLD